MSSKLRSNLELACAESLHLIKTFQTQAKDVEVRSLLCCLTADVYRYLAEDDHYYPSPQQQQQQQQQHVAKAKEAYDAAQRLCRSAPGQVMLQVALNHAVFQCEIRHEKAKAIAIAESALEAERSGGGGCEPRGAAHSLLISSLQRCLRLWKNN